MKQKNKERISRFNLFCIIFGVCFVLALALLSIAIWYISTFNLSLKDLFNQPEVAFLYPRELYTEGIITAGIVGAALAFILFTVCVILIEKFLYRKRIVWYRVGGAICAVSLLFSSVLYTLALRTPISLDADLSHSGFVEFTEPFDTQDPQTEPGPESEMLETDGVVTEPAETESPFSSIYEDHYVDSAKVNISANGKTKNLIYIYMESMETIYSNARITADAPYRNYIPNLTRLAQENVSFTQYENALGGFYDPIGTGWTMAALLATTSGIHFDFPQGHNGMSGATSFAKNLTTLGDILEDKGYQNVFLCGSDAKFGGRKLYFTQHGNYDIYDLYTARKEGYIASDYHDGWWGYEDHTLYDVAKDKLTELASSDQPFNFTMLTVDTHHNNGHRCRLCKREYGYVIENVVSCADRQIADFVTWLKEQPFYEDCTVVITGDHRRMDSGLVRDVPLADRTVYNCFLNASVSTEQTNNRICTSMDIFPTTLAAMGFKIDGDQLGLGVNLFSDRQTLAESMGYDVLHDQLNRDSLYYNKHFCD